MAKEEKEKGDAARDARDWASAAAHYKEYLVFRPDDWPLMVQLAHALKESGDLSGAVDAYRAAEIRAPENADLLLHLGHVLRKLSRLDEAKRCLVRCEKLIELKRDDAEHLRIKPLVQRELADCEELGIGGVDQSGPDDILKRESDVNTFVSYPSGLAMRLLSDAQAARDLADWYRAYDLYREYLANAPKDLEAWNEYLSVLIHCHRDQEAYDVLVRIELHNAPSITLINKKINLLRKLRRDDEAERLMVSLARQYGPDAAVDGRFA